MRIHTPVPPIEGYASYLAATRILHGAETLDQPALTLATAGATWHTPAPGEAPPSLCLAKSLDDLDEETDEDEDAVDADDEDEDEDDDEAEEDFDEDDDEDEADEDEDDDDDEDEDEEEEDEDGGVKPLKMAPSTAPRRIQ